MVFAILADGSELFRSETVNAAQAQYAKVDVTGVQRLELRVEDAGDGIAHDWGVWLGSHGICPKDTTDVPGTSRNDEGSAFPMLGEEPLERPGAAFTRTHCSRLARS